MAEDDGYSDGSESNFSSSHNQQKRETHCKNDVRFLRNTTCMGGSSERHEVLETGRSFNSTKRNSRSHKDYDHIFDDQNKPTHTILFKDNVYGSGDDDSRSVTAEVFDMSDEVNVKKI
ncbi:hypothetical protein Bca4012_078412 [Brassica carinata]